MKSWLESWRRLATATGAIGLAAALCAPAHALLNDGVFELDGNVADPAPAVLPDDWADFTAPPAQWNTKRATGIVGDPVPAVFRSGSKDTQDVSSWRYDLGSSPPKDNMLNAYAAAYAAPATTTTSTKGDLLIYFGADRDSFTGTASLGFWFFKQPLQRDDANGRFINPITNQPATHTDGDTLVAFEYTNGGAVSSVRIFRWQSGSLVDAGTIGVGATNVAGVFCDAADKVCGSTNSGSIALPWNGTIAAGQFFEGGINLSKEFPGSDTCFASFMATSRSSSQANASIKNFLLGNFPVCSLSVTKACNGGAFNAANNTVRFDIKGRIVNDGGGALANIQVTDNPAFDSGTLSFRTCANGEPTGTTQSPATLAVGADICFVASHTSTNQFTVKDVLTASASTGNGTISGQAEATCSVTPPPLGISVTKQCDLDLELDGSGKLALKVNFSGSVTNTGGARLTGVKVCETHEVDLGALDPCDASITHTEITIGDMDPGAVVPYSSSYYPKKALNGMGVSVLTQPHLATFKDQVSARGKRPDILGGADEKSSIVEATCPLCQ